MKIEIEVKAGTARRVAIVGVTLIIVGVAMGVHANQIQFSSGQTLTAADLNNNFGELYARTAKPTATLGGNQLSLNGVVCGQTAPSTGNLGGYRGAKLLCEAQCGSPTAHMCTSEEAVRTLQLGGTSFFGWISTGAHPSEVVGAPGDCSGWTSGAGGHGVFFNGGPADITCNTAIPVMCCD